MKMTCRQKIKAAAVPFALTLMLVAGGMLAYGQNSTPANATLNPRTDHMVCPLSDRQTQDSIAAFARVAAAFTLEDNGRCGNCHGGVNAFVDEKQGHHAGGAQNRAANKREACQGCHSGLPGWDVPSSDMFFMDGYHVPRKASQICKQIKGAFARAQGFVDHIAKNTDLADFNGTAFLGNRGLNQVGRVLAYDQPYHEEPPGISRNDMVQRAEAWKGAMDGEFKGDVSCGCEAMHFAVRVTYVAGWEIGGISQGMGQMGPVDIPIHFHDDGTYEGQGMLPFAAKGSAHAGPAYCADQSQGGMQVKVSGKAIEDPHEHQMHIELTNLTRNSGTTAQVCNMPAGSGVFALNGGDKATMGFDVIGRVGDNASGQFPLPTPFVKAVLSVQVVDQSAQPTTPH